MANPQKELGHIEVANDLWEALAKKDIPGRQLRVFNVIIRKTWGWNKKSDFIPLSQIAEATGIKRTHVCELIRWLKAAKMISREGDGRTTILKDYESWLVPPAGLPPKGLAKRSRQSRRRESASPAEGNQPVPPAGLSIYTVSKDTIQKTGEEEKSASPTLAGQELVKLSPREEAVRFFESDGEPIVVYLVTKGVPEKVARQEVEKFKAYWTEPTPSGKKQRWETEKTFEVKRRFVTWMDRAVNHRRGSSLSQEPKGIRI